MLLVEEEEEEVIYAYKAHIRVYVAPVQRSSHKRCADDVGGASSAYYRAQAAPGSGLGFRF